MMLGKVQKWKSWWDSKGWEFSLPKTLFLSKNSCQAKLCVQAGTPTIQNSARVGILAAQNSLPKWEFLLPKTFCSGENSLSETVHNLELLPPETLCQSRNFQSETFCPVRNSHCPKLCPAENSHSPKLLKWEFPLSKTFGFCYHMYGCPCIMDLYWSWLLWH